MIRNVLLLMSETQIPDLGLLGGFHDEFEDASLSTNRWRIVTGSPTVSGGLLTVPAGTDCLLATYQQWPSFPDTTIRVQFENVGAIHNQQLVVGDNDNLAIANGYIIYIYGGNIQAFKMGTGNIGTPLAYNPTIHKYFQLRFEGSGATVDVHFEVSEDTSSWTSVHIETGPAVTNGWVYLRTGGIGGTTDTHYFDNVDSTIYVPTEVVTLPVTSLTATTCTFNGSANPNGFGALGWFRYDTSDPTWGNQSLGTRIPSSGAAFLGGGTSPVGFSDGVTGLSPNTTYYYWSVSLNNWGYDFGNIQSFTTLP